MNVIIYPYPNRTCIYMPDPARFYDKTIVLNQPPDKTFMIRMWYSMKLVVKDDWCDNFEYTRLAKLEGTTAIGISHNSSCEQLKSTRILVNLRKILTILSDPYMVCLI